MSIRGVLFGWLGLVILETIVTVKGSDAVTGILGDISRMLDHALDPTVPGISDRSSGVWKKGNTFPTGSAPGDIGGVGSGHQFPSAPAGSAGGITPRPI